MLEIMKNLLYIFISLTSLCVFSSCSDSEEKNLKAEQDKAYEAELEALDAQSKHMRENMPTSL